MTREEFEDRYGWFFGQAQNVPINVDAMGEEELAACAAHPGVHSDVRAYARLLSHAFAHRAAGSIDLAMSLERKAERVYKHDIPASLRW